MERWIDGKLQRHDMMSSRSESRVGILRSCRCCIRSLDSQL